MLQIEDFIRQILGNTFREYNVFSLFNFLADFKIQTAILDKLITNSPIKLLQSYLFFFPNLTVLFTWGSFENQRNFIRDKQTKNNAVLISIIYLHIHP